MAKRTWINIDKLVLLVQKLVEEHPEPYDHQHDFYKDIPKEDMAALESGAKELNHDFPHMASTYQSEYS